MEHRLTNGVTSESRDMCNAAGQGSPDRPRHTAKDVYHEDGSCGDVWPTPEACSKDEDVKIMQDKSYKWDRESLPAP